MRRYTYIYIQVYKAGPDTAEQANRAKPTLRVSISLIFLYLI